MKRYLLLLSLFTTISLRAQTVDSANQISIPPSADTTIEAPQKKTFGEKLGKFLGIDKTEEIEALKNKIKIQTTVIDSLSSVTVEPKIVVKKVPSLNESQMKSVQKDQNFVNSLPKTYKNIPKGDLDKITKEIDDKITELIKQREALIGGSGNEELIRAKSNAITSLEREKSVINLSKQTTELQDENLVLTDKNDTLKVEGVKLRKYLYTSIIILFVLLLIIAVVIQRKRINVQDIEIEKQLDDIAKKNTYIEHAARIIRHDMHSGINTYIPRGINSLEKRLKPEDIENLKIESPLKMIKEGLNHTQKVYKGVYEFTNLVKKDAVLNKTKLDLKHSLTKYLSNASYSSQVSVGDLGEVDVNEALFCTAIDSLIKNGLKYNDSEIKSVKIYISENSLIVEDNGRGMDQKEFEKYLKPKDSETGLGISIASAILKEHGFDISCKKSKSGGTMIYIKIK